MNEIQRAISLYILELMNEMEANVSLEKQTLSQSDYDTYCHLCGFRGGKHEHICPEGARTTRKCRCG